MLDLRSCLTLEYIYIEPHYGCNRTCDFCGMVNLQPKKFKTMSLETAEKIAKNIPELEKCHGHKRTILEFAMRGEPTLNKQLPEIISIFDKYRDTTEIKVLTNGDFLTKELADNLFKAGVNIIAVDCYDNDYKERKKKYKTFGYEVIDESLREHVCHYYGSSVQGILMLRPTWTRTIINNQCGYINYENTKKYPKQFSKETPKEPINAFCPRPFTCISVYYDGTLSICPTNWTEEGVISHIDKEKSLYDYWYKNKELNKIRRAFKLENNKRICEACKKCDYDFFKFFKKDFLDYIKEKEEANQ